MTINNRKGLFENCLDICAAKNKIIKEGQNTLLLGASGCGKTTLMNIMAGLLKPSSGDVLFEGTNYASLSDQKIDKLRAENFGFIFQTLHLIGHLSVVMINW